MSVLTLHLEDRPLLIAGIMSGTSADGVDAALVRASGSRASLSFDLIGFASAPYSTELRQFIVRQAEEDTSDVRNLSQLNFRLVDEFVQVLNEALDAAGLSFEDLDVIGSHGHTVHHVPDAEEVAGIPITSTLQLGDPSVLAKRTGCVVVGDFRVADMAFGGQGAPLVPFLEYVVFSDPNESRGSLNLGGIANLSVIPAGCDASGVRAFDTGPANMVMDTLCRKHFGVPFDDGGKIGRAGTICQPLIDEVLSEPYFTKAPPKSTGREAFGEAFVSRFSDRLLELAPSASPQDMVATAAGLTAQSIFLAYSRFIEPTEPISRVIASGGGVHNPFLLELLQSSFGSIPVDSAADHIMNPDAKEAICFALMALETLQGVPTNLPSVTGATKATIQGKICLPG